MNIKGVTFDIGGVLYSDDVFKRAIKKALIELGAEVTDEKFEKVYDDHLKSGGGSLRSKLCTAFLGSLDRKAELLKVTNDFWIFETADIYSDSLPAVKSLKERGLLIGIVLDAPKAKDIALCLQSAGFLVNAANDEVIRIAPAFIVTEKQILAFVRAFSDACEEVFHG